MARAHFRRRLIRKIADTPPPAVLALLYFMLVVVGAALLKTPLSDRGDVTWSDAFFTSASAVTVTGLGVVDLATSFTPFGEAVIAGLIQLGGLGLMVFAVFVLAALGLPVGLGTRVFLREDLNQTSLADVMRLTRTVVKVVLICELGGAAALYPVFEPEFGKWAGLWHALFHSISAFNNAGFTTLPQGLVPYALNPVVNIVIPFLFITGGIGYVVVADIWRHRKWRKLSMHTKLMLTGTGALILVSVVFFAILEWNNPRTLGPLDGPVAKLTVSWFQGVTTRTAGFNTTDIGGMEDFNLHDVHLPDDDRRRPGLYRWRHQGDDIHCHADCHCRLFPPPDGAWCLWPFHSADRNPESDGPRLDQHDDRFHRDFYSYALSQERFSRYRL